MLITDVVRQERDSSRFNVYIDNKFFCGVSTETLAQYNIYQGRDIPEDELKKIQETEIYNRFLNRSLNYLSRAPKTEKQIKQYIRELAYKKKGKWFENIEKNKLEEITEKIVEKLHEFKYLDDRRYAETFVNSRLRNKPRGKNILLSELISKGVDKEIAQEVLNEQIEDEYEILKRTYQKKYKEEKITKQDRKKIDFLQRKGFSWNLIEQYINNESGE